MDKSDVVKPITTIVTGSNYNLWVQGMKNFLISRKLWQIVTGDITKPSKENIETDSKFADRLADWDSKNHQIITWICNTSVPSIHIQFTDYETAKEVWDFLANRYRTTGLAHYYQLWTALHHLKAKIQTIRE
ncbi:UBN2_3 domain-containing protein [Quillaja saponaria]|uniref:UBN2_3 domain-containing protein n=1 Tax=Quillaja saponaria TaxID=32244 RepID=A0AAD7LIR2_QUISA|nr:UBN2_3 domain-containing protein [Quillaja saponaria]